MEIEKLKLFMCVCDYIDLGSIRWINIKYNFCFKT